MLDRLFRPDPSLAMLLQLQMLARTTRQIRRTRERLDALQAQVNNADTIRDADEATLALQANQFALESFQISRAMLMHNLRKSEA